MVQLTQGQLVDFSILTVMLTLIWSCYNRSLGIEMSHFLVVYAESSHKAKES